jgi:saccharopine dehydrogenase-like NADP-dependent oxidoreductase
MQTIHWLGAGLSAVPGIRRLVKGDLPFVLWNRTVEKAKLAVANTGKEVDIRLFDVDSLAGAIKSGDIIVSMLPGSWHPTIAELSVDKGAHFVCSSYISPEMEALNSVATHKGLCLVNEVGLDPGIDHLMAHLLVDEYKHSPEYEATNTILFRSYCGGFPSKPNDFRYKFSWSPLGVLKALKTPSKSILESKAIDVQRPWHAITDYVANLPGARKETFEAYPNRDALPFIHAYHFDPEWHIDEFVRGTLRISGWAEAWKEIFTEIDGLEGEEGDLRLQEMSDELWQAHAYAEDESDRVVLCVELEAREKDTSVWQHGYSIDSLGDDKGSAMARLVSLTVSLAVDAIATGKIRPGVSAAPSDPVIVKEWFETLSHMGEHIERI